MMLCAVTAMFLIKRDVHVMQCRERFEEEEKRTDKAPPRTAFSTVKLNSMPPPPPPTHVQIAPTQSNTWCVYIFEDLG
ncbi:hypothetical protein QJS04_geneDACA017465 [Acorus gramineus]|uniref:Uncharacterized protein n=1 Tax=Acorus gramineus TaxID=55184 RepID=A0AAV9AGE1_ACOGR|nr:hypothetical protein QJS04_geneDACA017465 [Acorus gramineus]